MRNGHIDVGNETATLKSAVPNSTRIRVCGAMMQQSCDSDRGNQSSPQKFVRLVGYRDPKARTLPAISGPAAVKG